MKTTDKLSKNLSAIGSTKIDQGPLSESALWRAVLAQAISDTAHKAHTQRLEIVKWIGTNDFVTVCDFAEIDNEIIKEQIENILRIPSMTLRKHYSKLLCRCINDRTSKPNAKNTPQFSQETDT
jgi:hypothetical protein